MQKKAAIKLATDICKDVNLESPSCGKLITWFGKEPGLGYSNMKIYSIGLSDTLVLFFENSSSFKIFKRPDHAQIEDAPYLDSVSKRLMRLQYAIVCFRKWDYSLGWRDEHFARLVTTGQPFSYKSNKYQQNIVIKGLRTVKLVDDQGQHKSADRLLDNAIIKYKDYFSWDHKVIIQSDTSLVADMTFINQVKKHINYNDNSTGKLTCWDDGCKIRYGVKISNDYIFCLYFNSYAIIKKSNTHIVDDVKYISTSPAKILERLISAITCFKDWQYGDGWNSEHFARLVTTNDSYSYITSFRNDVANEKLTIFILKSFHADSWAKPVFTELGLPFSEEKLVCSVSKHEQDKSIIAKALSSIEKPNATLRNEGYELAVQGNYSAAIECYTKALKIDPRDNDTWHLKGLAHFCKNTPSDVDESLTCFEQSLLIDLKNPAALQGKAVVLLYQGKPNEALDLLQQVNQLIKDMNSNTEVAQLWYYRGELFFAMQHMKSAQQCFEKAKSANPNHSLTAQRLAQIQLFKSERSWHFDAAIKTAESEKKEDYIKKPYKLIDASPSDIRKVISFYQHHPIPKKDIKSIQIIYNPKFNRAFDLKLGKLQERKGNSAFNPTWNQKADPKWRQKIRILYEEMASCYTDSDYPDVKLLPLWHGTKPQLLDSIFKTGYANLAETDPGFFGKGIYSAHEAEYAYRVYSNGALILNWVASYSAFPTMDGDMARLATKNNLANYDAHFVPVVPKTHDPNEVIYYPTKSNQQYTYIEVVVFDTEQCLPRYLVELQPNLAKPISYNPNSFFKSYFMKSTADIDLTDAAYHVYKQYLSKPYTLIVDAKGNDWSGNDWSYRYADRLLQRPNHGLAHTLRTLFYAPYVVRYFLAHDQNPHKLSLIEKKEIEANIRLIQLALLFFVVGRENEMGSRDDASAYNRFRKNSAEAFTNYINAKILKFDEKIIKLCADAILYSDFKKSPIHAILKTCHDIDSMRCFDSHIYSLVCQDIHPYIGKNACDELQGLVEQCLIQTGDRVMAATKYRAYNGSLFIQASQDVQHCEAFIQLAIEEWENSLFKNKLIM